MAINLDWKVQAVHKTFKLIVGQELAETAYDSDGDPITVTQTKEGSEEKVEVETTTNKIKPFLFEENWGGLIGDTEAEWSLTLNPKLKKPLRATAPAETNENVLPDGLTLIQGPDFVEYVDDNSAPYVIGTPTTVGHHEVTFNLWASNETTTLGERVEAYSADDSGEEYEVTEEEKDYLGLDLIAGSTPGMYIVHIPRAKWIFDIEAAPVAAEVETIYTWEQKTLGQNKKIQEVVASAAKASELLNANMALAKGGIKAAQLFLTTVMNPKVIILNTIADAIDSFVEDFLGTGFYILEVVPEGSETVPKSADGNPIMLALAPAAVAANYATALAAGLGTEFTEWTTAYFGKKDPKTLTTKDLKEVPQGNSEPLGKRVNDANSDRIAPMKGVFGFPAMTPPQVISTMIAAIDDPLDDQRPTFSANVEVGAIVMVMGFSNLAVNVGDFRATIQAMVDFFGGEQGMFTEGFKKLGKIMEAALGQHEDPTKHDITVQLVNVSGVLGTEEDLKTLEDLGVPANFPANFTVNDFIVGPRLKYGARAIGYISKADEDDITEDEGKPNSVPKILPNKNYVNQKVTIRGATETDYLAWKNLSSGAQIQRAHFYQSRNSWVDQNTSAVTIGEYENDFKLFDELPFNWEDPTIDKDGNFSKKPQRYIPEKAVTKVERVSKKAAAGTEFDPYLSPVGNPENVIKIVGQEAVGPAGQYLQDVKMTKDIIGTVLEQDRPKAPHPNFKNATLEDLIGDFKTFFGAIQTFTNQLRDIAGDTTKAIDDMVKFLDDRIKDLDKINADLQKVLKLFTTGLPDAGVYVLIIPPDGVAGVEGIKAAISGAANPPPGTLSHSVGFLMIGDKVSTGILTKLLAP